MLLGLTFLVLAQSDCFDPNVDVTRHNQLLDQLVAIHDGDPQAPMQKRDCGTDVGSTVTANDDRTTTITVNDTTTTAVPTTSAVPTTPAANSTVHSSAPMYPGHIGMWHYLVYIYSLK